MNRRLVKRKKDTLAEQQQSTHVEDDKPSKLEYEVAKYMIRKLPEKKTTLMGEKIEYFISSKAIDLLLDSKWATKKPEEEEALFTTRESVVEFLQVMLEHKFFHRASKIIVKDTKTKKITSAATDDKKDSGNESGDKKKKEKRKVKLDMHNEQIYVDGNEPYVWIYEMVSFRSWLFGFLLMFAVVAVCLFPLWPRVIRNNVYYLSVAAALFLLVIIGLAVLKMVVFVLIWAITFGKHHLWILPNLTEDVGFFESFWPLYHYEYRGGKSDKDDENNDKPEGQTNDKDDKVEKEDETKETSDANGAEQSNDDEQNQDNEKDDEQPLLNKQNEDNGFEIINPEDAN